MAEGNKVKKNLQKSTTSGIAAAMATILAKVAMNQGWVPVETEPYLIVIITGALVGAHDFLRHSATVQGWLKKHFPKQ